MNTKNKTLWEQAVARFLQLENHKGNWQTSKDNSKWNINNDAYINGIILTLDLDLQIGYLIEIVEHESSQVTYGIVMDGIVWG